MSVPRRALELALDYRCNLRCLGCRACHDTGERVAPEDAARRLREARDAGARTAWFGGGEPTLRDDLLALVRHARALGYDEVVVQTNGLRLAYEDYARALCDAGVTEVRVNAKSHRADVHDALSRVDGAHALLLTALSHLAPRSSVRLAADLLLARATTADLPGTIAFFARRGVRRFGLWLLSAFDAEGDAEVAAEVPRLSDCADAIRRAAEVARANDAEIASFHTPPCTLPPSLRALWTPAADLGTTIVDPAGRAFALESSPFEGGARVNACGSCAMRDRCGGPRADYVRIHGATEFTSIAPA